MGISLSCCQKFAFQNFTVLFVIYLHSFSTGYCKISAIIGCKEEAGKFKKIPAIAFMHNFNVTWFKFLKSFKNNTSILYSMFVDYKGN